MLRWGAARRNSSRLWSQSRRYIAGHGSKQRQDPCSSSVAELECVVSPDDGRDAHELLRKNPVGLYGYEALKTAKGFRAFAETAIAKSEDLIARVKELPPSMETIKCMDDISNTVCMVVDAAELCRNTHPDKEYVDEANAASLKLYKYLHYLNTHKSLYDAVVHVESSDALTTEEAKRAAKTLRIDFERGGIHLPPEKMERVNELNLEITRLGREFTENMQLSQGHVDVFPASKVPESLHHLMQPIRSHSKSWKSKSEDTGLRISTDAGVVSSVLKWVPDAEIRKEVYICSHSTAKNNLLVLDKLIESRHELAQLIGFNSYAEFATAPTMAGSSEVVQSFLHDLLSQTQSKANEELKMLESFARSSSIEPWDEAYYTGMYKARAQNLDSKVISSYFPLERCMNGLKVIVKSLFDASFEQVSVAPGEVWHSDVQKWELRHSTEGCLGHMFLDLYSRKEKYPNCAHFTLKGGRRTSETEYQLPVVALVCNFSKPLSSMSALLHHWEVENLFHEFGHALHSLLSRTEYQHFSGTRTVIDFAETPSNVFECFAWDYQVLKTFAQNSAGETIPEKMVVSMNQAKKMLGVTELLRQVLYAMVDQKFFGPQPLPAGGTTGVLVEMQELSKNWKHIEGTHWQSKFGHMITYGAGYYSYLYARCIAASIWQKVCAANPLSLETGQTLRRGILQHGGAKEPADILRDCLGQDSLITAPSGGVRPCVKQLLSDLGV
ncbi:hypothetical protein SELMODRAFT_420134 [Selaginella moellendorffii]|uniref:Peptidase M3A/M3B catalytic domain-containing protein n=1 Tax=Selaginella moellendorffii TaxID=88036 RepID=D8SB27_SELML|nr:mitochondrial intermediate peptidase, mitochondrial [Selaginella moellendorffii]EFJ18321.1 hypothetical protein SELMODRAFT_420134 [Selaginella moellendorffii]|eukprot:XP_002980670.1 mitochondrial intermediate peptidase, mitochondrial [Selaginella moellendorffii]